MIIVSPGVYTREIDFSLYVPQLATSVFGIVTTASKGPVNEITLITDEASLVDTFGPPSADHLGLYAGIRYLRQGRQLKVVRVANYDQTATGYIRDAADAGNAVALTGTSSGSWGNSTTLMVTAGTDAGTYKVTVLYAGVTAEVFDLLKVGAANVDDANYIETRMNGVSAFVSVVADTTYSDLEIATATMTGGDDGAPALESDYVGIVGAPPVIPATGLQLFANPEDVDVNIIACPGIAYDGVVTAMVTLCETRADCICLIDVPYGKTVKQAVAWTNGLGGGVDDPTAALNSSYAAAFYPWVQVYDGYTNANVWIPPSGHVAGAIAYTDYVADPWWAMAGLNRGLLRDVLQVEHSATQGERDYMYSNGNIVNPVINLSGQGIVIWGQRTTQRAPTALDRINVRRLLLYMRKGIATAVQYLLFEPNDEVTWARFRLLVGPVMEEIKGRRGVTDYQVICDDTTNTSVSIARNELRGKISFVPTKAAKMIVVDFVVLNNQAQFTEF